MRPQLGSQAVGALCLVLAGCAPALQGTGSGGVVGARGRSASVAETSSAPRTCELTYTEGDSATIECRETGGEAEPARPSFDEGGDDLAPDPFAERVSADDTWTGTPTTGDDLAPDPFAGPRPQATVEKSQRLADDDLAPDPFAEERRETTFPTRRPLADDDLAPDPFAGPAR